MYVIKVTKNLKFYVNASKRVLYIPGAYTKIPCTFTKAKLTV